MPKIVNHDSYRLDLLTRCFSLFIQHGYGNVSMRQISEELGVSTGTLYHYFPNKKAIFKQMFRVFSQMQISQVTEDLNSSTSLKERLELLFSFVREAETEILNFIFLTFDFYRVSHSEEDDDFIKSTLAEYREAIIQLSGLPSDLALLVYSALDGLIMQRFYSPEKVDFDSQLALLSQMILKQMQDYSEK